MVAQVITIVNQSGKVVKTSKTLVNVFNEAKNAYAEKKAEIKALRQRDWQKHEEGNGGERKARRQLEALTLADEDTRSHRSSRHSEDGRTIRRKPVQRREERPPIERGISDSFYTNDERDIRPHRPRHGSSRHSLDANSRRMQAEPVVGELVRRHTSGLELVAGDRRPKTPTRSASLSEIDMDLAYGELPPPLPARRGQDTLELREKMTGLQRLLDECNCLQHSVTATIENLSKNPDAMAAVALTLAEISNLATKLAPGALTAMKGSFPAIVALLASPQFAIAAGVGVGVTIIALGGYKIIKKIQARKDEERLLAYGGEDAQPSAGSVDELREINSIESWRRGIAEAESESAGTSVDGEFITPVATRTLIEEGKLTEADLKSSSSAGKRRKKSTKGGSKVSSKTSKSRKVKEPSGLRMLFKSHKT